MFNYLTFSCLCYALMGLSLGQVQNQNTGFSYPTNWNYQNTQGWPQSCSTGSRQSGLEIDYILPGMQIETNTMEPMRFSYYDQIPAATKLTNIGHTLKLSFTFNNRPQISQAGLSTRYNLTEVHFRWGAVSDLVSTDNTFKQWPSDVEIQLIHVKSTLPVYQFGGSFGSTTTDLDQLIQQAYGQQDAFAILSVHLNAVQQDSNIVNQALKPLFDSIPSVAQTIGSTKDISNFNLKELLPRNTDSFLRYDGSFTYPNCTETVIWTVFKSRIMTSFAQLDAFSQVQTAPRSFRPKQLLNGRIIRDVETSYRLLSYGSKNVASIGLTIAMIWTAVKAFV